MRRDRRPRRDRNGPTVLAGLVALGLLVGRAQDMARGANGLDPLTTTAQMALAPPAIAVGAAIDGVERTAEGWTATARIAEENRALRARLAAIDLYEERVALLERELAASRPSGRRSVPARIVGYAASEGRLTLDVGRRAGITPGMGVVNRDGLLATIQTVTTTGSVALTLGSPSLRFGVMDLSTTPPIVGLARGTGADETEVTFYSPDAPVRVGDAIVTSGFSAALPRGLIVGRVARVSPRPEFGQVRAIVTPAADVGASRAVEVVR